MNARKAWLGGLLLAALVGAPTVAAAAGSQGAARIEFAASCQTPDYPMCSPELFGIRYTLTLDPGGNGTIAGSYSKHQRGGGGAGAEPINGPIQWWASTGPNGFAVGVDPANLYYNVDLGNGALSFPQTQGHYSSHPAPGVAVETNVSR